MRRDTMRAVVAYSSDPASLRCETVPLPTPGSGEVLVEVRATAVTAGELTWPERWPVIPGHDVAGTVVELGVGVEGVEVGDEVIGLIDFDRPGAAAEYVAVSAEALAAKPRAADQVSAATLPLGGLTAWQALFDHGRLAKGQHVLVHGAAGGVGIHAVQLAALHGATVTATAGAADAAFVSNLGAHRAIDYSTRFEEHVSDVDIVIDTVGGAVTDRSWEVLRPRGILVGVAEEPPPAPAHLDGACGMYFVVEPRRDQLMELARMVDCGQLRLTTGAVYPVEEMAAAIVMQGDTHVRGKVAIEVRPHGWGLTGAASGQALQARQVSS
jgi:NADPH:quinone reductase-like Zn-dependent oxidoreductase